MAASLVWSEGLLPLAGIQSLQNARSRAALALPRLHALPRLQRGALSTGDAAVPRFCRRQRQESHFKIEYFGVSRGLQQSIYARRLLPTPNPGCAWVRGPFCQSQKLQSRGPNWIGI